MKSHLRGPVIFLFLAFAVGALSMARAQERPLWGSAVSFANGTFIQTGIGAVPSGGFDLKVSTSVATTASITPEQGTFRRILKLSDGRAIVYEIAVKRLNEGQRFEVTLSTWKPTLEEARELDINPGRVETSFLSNYTAPLTINDGDTLALDVLINPRTGVKLVDYFRITSRRPIAPGGIGDPTAKARTLQVDDLEFFVNKFSLWLNGQVIYTSGGGMGGRFIWLDIPQTGRFIFSLIPLSEIDGFHRSAYVSRQRIVFMNGPDKYELTSEGSIIPASGVFHLWVRHDPTFTFPSTHRVGNYFSIGAADDLPLLQHKKD